jgi:hypothetical protein
MTAKRDITAEVLAEWLENFTKFKKFRYELL